MTSSWKREGFSKYLQPYLEQASMSFEALEPVILMEGTGHYPMFEKPEEFTKRLKEAVGKIEEINRG